MKVIIEKLTKLDSYFDSLVITRENNEKIEYLLKNVASMDTLGLMKVDDMLTEDSAALMNLLFRNPSACYKIDIYDLNLPYNGSCMIITSKKIYIPDPLKSLSDRVGKFNLNKYAKQVIKCLLDTFFNFFNNYGNNMQNM